MCATKYLPVNLKAKTFTGMSEHFSKRAKIIVIPEVILVVPGKSFLGVLFVVK